VAGAGDGTPKWLLEKSIKLQYRETREFERVGFGWAHKDTVDSRTEIYISSQGRIFARTQEVVDPRGQAQSYARLRVPTRPPKARTGA
jgi:hypothetical protein